MSVILVECIDDDVISKLKIIIDRGYKIHYIIVDIPPLNDMSDIEWMPMIILSEDLGRTKDRLIRISEDKSSNIHRLNYIDIEDIFPVQSMASDSSMRNMMKTHDNSQLFGRSTNRLKSYIQISNDGITTRHIDDGFLPCNSELCPDETGINTQNRPREDIEGEEKEYNMSRISVGDNANTSNDTQNRPRRKPPKGKNRSVAYSIFVVLFVIVMIMIIYNVVSTRPKKKY